MRRHAAVLARGRASAGDPAVPMRQMTRACAAWRSLLPCGGFWWGRRGTSITARRPWSSALTGIDADRLPEEKKRGITIDLGFAHAEWEGVRLSLRGCPRARALRQNMLRGSRRHRRRPARHRGGRVGQRRRRGSTVEIDAAPRDPQGLIAVTKTDRVAGDLVAVTVSRRRATWRGGSRFWRIAPIVPGLLADGRGA